MAQPDGNDLRYPMEDLSTASQRSLEIKALQAMIGLGRDSEVAVRIRRLSEDDAVHLIAESAQFPEVRTRLMAGVAANNVAEGKVVVPYDEKLQNFAGFLSNDLTKHLVAEHYTAEEIRGFSVALTTHGNMDLAREAHELADRLDGFIPVQPDDQPADAAADHDYIDVDT